MAKEILGIILILQTCIHQFSIAQTARHGNQGTNDPQTSTNILPIEEDPDHNIRMRHRYREYRLNMIRQQILDSLGWSKPPIIDPETRENLFSNSAVTPRDQDRFTHEKHCYASRCNIPDSIDYSLWTENTNILHLYQEVPEFTTRKQLTSATLRLYIRYETGSIGGSSRLLISVSQFLRPLHIRRRGGRVINRKRLIDAKMVNRQGASWVILNVKDAVKDWITGSRENYGLAIAVKDENENEVNASALFQQIDCLSPSNIGCREEDDMTEPGTMWTVGSSPYLQIDTKERVRHRHRRHTPKLSAQSESTYLDTNSLLKHTIRDDKSVCLGKSVRKPVSEQGVITPRHYETLECSGTCKGGKSCQGSRFERVKGFVFTPEKSLSYQDIGILRTVECSCMS